MEIGQLVLEIQHFGWLQKRFKKKKQINFLLCLALSLNYFFWEFQLILLDCITIMQLTSHFVGTGLTQFIYIELGY